ncbi:DsrE family protein [Stenotrophomonas sp. Y6]|jgi:intracellular sulfur oxidation DsrE/DsrF family protein|uniref:DsrE family protein n=1 Tax=Stenotrophomonas sp. Y6 TaxID=2920383 RepID=UPI001F06FDDD|nr:DsrE family protein [Stenotrophomonas sp. Y6]MCH1907207.1 DsrE family protein [Stenotrophomonas sp. Y6]
MKTTVFSLLFAVLAFFASPTNGFAQGPQMPDINKMPDIVIPYEGTSTKFALMVSDVLHFKAAVLTAKQMDVKKKGLTFEIVAVGAVVKDLANDHSLAEWFAKSEDYGAKIVVCENAMAVFGVTKDQLDKRLSTTRSGTIHLLELKDKGYNTLHI